MPVLTTSAPTCQVLAALEEIAFKPQFLPLRIEKERKAVLVRPVYARNRPTSVVPKGLQAWMWFPQACKSAL